MTHKSSYFGRWKWFQKSWIVIAKRFSKNVENIKTKGWRHKKWFESNQQSNLTTWKKCCLRPEEWFVFSSTKWKMSLNWVTVENQPETNAIFRRTNARRISWEFLVSICKRHRVWPVYMTKYLWSKWCCAVAAAASISYEHYVQTLLFSRKSTSLRSDLIKSNINLCKYRRHA